MAATAIVGVSVAEVTGAEASTSFGAALAATDFAAGAVWRWATTASWILSTKLPFAPATNSCWRLRQDAAGEVEIDDHARAGRNLPVHPDADIFHAVRPTLMRLCAVAITVLGKSTTMRAGESSVVTRGVNLPVALNSTRNPSWL